MRHQNDEPTKAFAIYDPEMRHSKLKRGCQKILYRAKITQQLTGKADKTTLKEIENMANDRNDWKKCINEQYELPNQ